MNESKLPSLSTVGDDFSELLSAASYMSQGHMGGFAGCIGDAMLVADAKNLEKLARAFPDLIQCAWDQLSINS